jgi:hypothetical protein
MTSNGLRQRPFHGRKTGSNPVGAKTLHKSNGMNHIAMTISKVAP